MTRAPRSASWRVANGAAIACSSVTTVRPLRGCMVDSWLKRRSAQRRDRVHRQPAFVVLRPQLDGLAIGLQLAVDPEGVQIEGRLDGLEAEACDVGVGC